MIGNKAEREDRKQGSLNRTLRLKADRQRGRGSFAIPLAWLKDDMNLLLEATHGCRPLCSKRHRRSCRAHVVAETTFVGVRLVRRSRRITIVLSLLNRRESDTNGEYRDVAVII